MSERSYFRFLPASAAAGASSSMEKAARVFIRLGLSPNALTALGLAMGAAAGIFFGLPRPFWAGTAVLLCGAMDILDGTVAAKTGRRSAFGAILDSSADRYTEFFMYAGLAYHFRLNWAIWLAFLAFLGSTMVSYTRARAEGLGFSCAVGIMQRAERIVLLAGGAFAGWLFGIYDLAMIVALTMIAAFSNITAFQRIQYVKKADRLKQERHETSARE
jgi:phosphatidylglycerophosphate synthase